jgi:Uma2 family endonuclease
MGEKALATYSIEAYLAGEAEAEFRHEFHNGELFAMAGGTRNHGTLGNAINTELNLLCRNRPCIPYNGDVKIRIEASNRFVYPEASVVCGKIETSVHDAESITNPVLIAEVLSDSSESYDRGAKFRLYRQLPAFREYLLIDQHRPVVTVFYRREDKIWEMREVMGLDQTIRLQSLEADIQMADLYRNTEDLKEPLEE